jgi:hypothetical protein
MMSLGKRDREKQDSIWIPYNKAPRSPGHPFYEKLNELLEKDGFDGWVEDLCAKYFKQKGRVGPRIMPIRTPTDFSDSLDR